MNTETLCQKRIDKRMLLVIGASVSKRFYCITVQVGDPQVSLPITETGRDVVLVRTRYDVSPKNWT